MSLIRYVLPPGASVRALVTGASGFVGRAVCRALGVAGYAVRAALRTGESRPLAGCDNVVVGDINAETDWTRALDDVQVVVHLAGRTHRRDPANALERYRRINVDGTVALSKAAREAAVGAFVFMSSIKVNGEVSPTDSAGRPLRFSGETVPAPTTPYGQSKLEAELALDPDNPTSSMRVVILRPPLVYGPGQKGNLARLARAIEHGWPLPLAALKARRSLIGVDNLADAVVAAAAPDNALSGTFTLADTDLSTAELIGELGNALGRRPCLVAVPLPVLDVLAAVVGLRGQFDKMSKPLLVDRDKYSAASGWSPRRTFEQGLRGAEIPSAASDSD